MARNALDSFAKPSIAVERARKELGTLSIGMSDDELRSIIEQVDILTDIVVAHANDSNIQSSIDILNDEVHTDD
jgi:hypothetical protein